MLLEFSVGNFLSFKTINTLRLSSTGLQSSVLYGVNASGKSNFVAAMKFMYIFMLKSAHNETPADLSDGLIPFLLYSKAVYEPSFFELVFESDGFQFRYGFEVNQQEVLHEWLYYRSPTEPTTETPLFIRQASTLQINDHDFEEGLLISVKPADHELFLSVMSENNGKICQKITTYITDNILIISGLPDTDLLDEQISIQLLNHPMHRKRIIDLLQIIDPSIIDLALAKISLGGEMPGQASEQDKKSTYNYNQVSVNKNQDEQYRLVVCKHRQYASNGNYVRDVVFNIDTQEAHSVRKLFVYAGLLSYALAKGGLVIIDAIETHLHPNLVKQLIEWFNTPSINTSQAQLVLTSYNSQLIKAKFWQPSQVWLVEKDKQQASMVYPLSELTLPNIDYNTNYIIGKHGKILF